MPHIVIEHSNTLENIDLNALAHDLHQDLASRDTVSIAAIKTRSHPVYNCVVGDDAQQDLMMHIILKLLPGRDNALKSEMAKGLYDTAKSAIAGQNVSLSVEVQELHADTYQK